MHTSRFAPGKERLVWVSDEKKNIFDSFISIGTYQGFIDEIISFAHSKIPSYVCFANVHMVVEAYRDKSFQKVINDANLVAPDGRPLSIFLRLSEGIKQDRVCGMDIFPDLLKKAAESGKAVYFYGTTEKLLKTIVHKAMTEFPALKIAGFHSPPFRTLTEEEEGAITEMINGAEPDLVFVALGCPKQEKWMAEHKNKINACLVGLGQAFKVYAGEERRLPRWMRDLSLEWVCRLCQEPGRLWKRYAFTNCYFLFLVARELVLQFFRGHRFRIE
jgi:N-acetylglucosaminyldiphosphoundecaprenol N-acetyl-beta-D-mannosaminyltransferase